MQKVAPYQHRVTFIVPSKPLNSRMRQNVGLRDALHRGLAGVMCARPVRREVERRACCTCNFPSSVLGQK
eukprot:8121181-Pyramimonas_sp.AAC.1